MARPGLLLDRDGVVVEDLGPWRPGADLTLLAGAAAAIGRAQRLGVPIAVVTNQTCIARGLCSEEDVARAHTRLDAQLSAAGAQPLGHYLVCPHHPHADVAAYRQDCGCRKPKPGLLEAAARSLDLDLGRSVLVGDRPSDIAAGRRAGCFTIQVLCGRHADPPIVGLTPADPVVPHRTVADLDQAVTLALDEVWG